MASLMLCSENCLCFSVTADEDSNWLKEKVPSLLDDNLVHGVLDFSTHLEHGELMGCYSISISSAECQPLCHGFIGLFPIERLP